MEQRYVIENSDLRAEICPVGAQLRRLYDKKNKRDLLWDGDPAIWRDSAPWLFPIVGKLKDNTYTHEGTAYKMPAHGFAKRCPFAPKAEPDGALTFTLTDSDETRAFYPWRFTFTVRYALDGAALRVRCTVRNEDDKPLYYSIGAHPGFVCESGDQLDFGCAQGIKYHALTREHLLHPDSAALPLKDGLLTLKPELFADDALILDHPDCARIALRRANGPDVALSFDRVPWLGLWSRYTPEGLKYICLEPWLGVDDPVDADGDITHKEAIQRLERGEEAAFSIAIETGALV